MPGEVITIDPENYPELSKIEDGEVVELKSVIAKTAGEIINLEFWNKTCGEKDCEHCTLRRLLQ